MRIKSISQLLTIVFVLTLLLLCPDSSARAQVGKKGEVRPPVTTPPKGGSTNNESASARAARLAREKAARERAARERAAKGKAERERIRQEAEERIANERAERDRAEREAAKERAAREAAEAKRAELEALLPNGKIQSLRVESAVAEDGKMGVQIHVKFDINNLKDIECGVAAYFYNASVEPLKDINNSFANKAGHVSVGQTYKPTFPKSSYEDFPLFLPYEELHLSRGDHKLKVFASLWVGDKTLAQSEWVDFQVSSSELAEAERVSLRPRGKIEALRVEHNATLGGELGIKVHFNLTLYNVKDVECNAIAFFYDAKEVPLKGSGYYASDKGTLSTPNYLFTPTLAAAYYEDFTLFLPYKVIQLSKGTHDLKFFVGIHAKGIGYFTKSGWGNFQVNVSR